MRDSCQSNKNGIDDLQNAAATNDEVGPACSTLACFRPPSHSLASTVIHIASASNVPNLTSGAWRRLSRRRCTLWIHLSPSCRDVPESMLAHHSRPLQRGHLLMSLCARRACIFSEYYEPQGPIETHLAEAVGDTCLAFKAMEADLECAGVPAREPEYWDDSC